MARVYIGTSGWNYAHWRDDFYAGVRRADWLAYYAERFAAVEVNTSFYRLPAETTLAGWRTATPADFRFCLKGNRYVTHTRRLLEPLALVARERQQLGALGDKLAVMLWQLPANFGKTMARLEGFVAALAGWPGVRHAIEFRHASWFDDEVAGCLRRANVAVCQSDAADWSLWPAVTTDLVYVRLHGHTRTYASRYNRPSLVKWAERIGDWRGQNRTVHVYFDNDGEGHAPANALQLQRLIAPSRAGDRRS